MSVERVAELKLSMDKLLVQTDAAHTIALRHELTQSIEKEMTIVKQALMTQWETQKAALVSDQAAFENKRASLFREMVEKEAQLHSSQADLIKQYQQRLATQNSSTKLLQELHEGNRKLKEELATLLERNRSSGPAVDVASILALQERLVQATVVLAKVDANSSPLRQLHSPPSDGAVVVHGVAPSSPTTRSQEFQGTQQAESPRAQEQKASHHHHHHNNNSNQHRAEVAAVAPAPMPQPTPPPTDETAARSLAESKASPSPLVVAGDVATRMHINVLDALCEELEPELQQAATKDAGSAGEQLFRAFEHRLGDLYDALCFKHALPSSPYRGALKEFLVAEEPKLLPALDAIAYLYEGHEAEFADFVVLEAVGRRTSTLKTWVKVTPLAPDAPPYYYSTLSLLSQRENPLGSAKKSTPMAVAKEIQFSSVVEGSKLAANPTLSEARAPELRSMCTALITGTAIRYLPSKLGEVEKQLAQAGPREWEVLFTLQEIALEKASAKKNPRT